MVAVFYIGGFLVGCFVGWMARGDWEVFKRESQR